MGGGLQRPLGQGTPPQVRAHPLAHVPLQGSRLLPLLKLTLRENLQLSTAAEAAADATPAAAPPSSVASAAERKPAAQAVADAPYLFSDGGGSVKTTAERHVLTPDSGSDGGGSVKSTAGTPPAPRAPPDSPATPAVADAGRLKEPPRTAAVAVQQGEGRQEAQQAQQGAAFSLDDLLGLSWEDASEPQASHCCCLLLLLQVQLCCSALTQLLTCARCCACPAVHLRCRH